MLISKIQRCMFFIVLGFLFIAVDLYARTGIEYPHEYKNDKNIIGEFQYYNIKTFYGATCTLKKLDTLPDADDKITDGYYTDAEFIDDVFFNGFRIDILNDIVGLILIAISCFIMSQYRFTFKFALFFSFLAIVLKLALTSLPFIFNGMSLCNIALGVGIAYMISLIITTFFITRSYISLIHDSCCRDERKWLNTSWFVFMILMILIFILTWLDLYAMAYFFTAVITFDVIFFGLVLKRTDEFVARHCKA